MVARSPRGMLIAPKVSTAFVPSWCWLPCNESRHCLQTMNHIINTKFYMLLEIELQRLQYHCTSTKVDSMLLIDVGRKLIATLLYNRLYQHETLNLQAIMFCRMRACLACGEATPSKALSPNHKDHCVDKMKPDGHQLQRLVSLNLSVHQSLSFLYPRKKHSTLWEERGRAQSRQPCLANDAYMSGYGVSVQQAWRGDLERFSALLHRVYKVTKVELSHAYWGDTHANGHSISHNASWKAWWRSYNANCAYLQA